MAEASKNHTKIAANINELVVIPFGRWCDAHEARVTSSHDDLQARIRAHDKQAELVRKLRSAYFNKCRQLEDLEEEGKLAFQPPEKSETSPKGKTPTIKLQDEQGDGPDPVEIGDETYDSDRLKALVTEMLISIPMGETKVAFLGTYTNVSSGADIVLYIQRNLSASSVSYAERMGQDLVALGFLRLIGNVGSTFANSSRMYYQWRPKAYQFTGVQEKKKLERVGSMGSDVESPVMASVGDMLQGYNLNPFNNPYPNETPGDRLKRETLESDEKYKQAVRKLDSLRCNLEEAIIDHLKFMERCELDRLKALKAVMLDFSGAMSNVIPSLQSTVDNMMLYQEAVQPLADLRYLLENYKTGTFAPKVQTYDNYYNNVDGQTFGVDLEARARQDRKRVPIAITSILTFLDSHYPDLEGDVSRREVWTVDVPLAATHHLRAQINDGQPPSQEILERYEVPIVASVLKLYLIELPGTLIHS
jgi:Domain found in Dishevelled, Egl-10, and Pleckstrin (DEP)